MTLEIGLFFCILQFNSYCYLYFSVFCIIHWFGTVERGQYGSSIGDRPKRSTFDSNEPSISFEDFQSPESVKTKKEEPVNPAKCRMNNCFEDFNCKKYGFSVFIYPVKEEYGSISKYYQNILDSIRRSAYYTEDIDKACIKGEVCFFRLVIYLDKIARNWHIRYFLNFNTTWHRWADFFCFFFYHKLSVSLKRLYCGFVYKDNMDNIWAKPTFFILPCRVSLYRR